MKEITELVKSKEVIAHYVFEILKFMQLTYHGICIL